MSYKIIQVDSDTWRIEDEDVRFFLLTGREKGVVIDTGMTTRNAREIAASLTDLPLILLNTHADIDHIAGNDAFETAYMHPAEYVNYFRNGASHPVPTPVWDGDRIDPGGRPLQIIEQPGHTPGSIAILDLSRRVLYCADSIEDGVIYMFGPMRNFYAYRQSLARLWGFRDQYDEIYPSHGPFPLKPEILPAMMRDADRILSGEGTPTEDVIFGLPVNRFPMDTVTLVLDR